jgi:hypothetical protein
MLRCDWDGLLRRLPDFLVVGQFAFGGRAILPRGPLWGRLSAGSGRPGAPLGAAAAAKIGRPPKPNGSITRFLQYA